MAYGVRRHCTAERSVAHGVAHASHDEGEQTSLMTGGIVSPLRFELVGRQGLPRGWTPPCPSLGTSTVGSSQTARGVPSAGRAGGFGQSVPFLSGGARNTLDSDDRMIAGAKYVFAKNSCV